MKHTKIRKCGDPAKKKKRAFSLLEIMLACALITLCAGMCAINFWGSREELTKKEVIANIQKTCALAHSFAELTKSAVRVVFEEKESAWFMSLKGAFAAAPSLKRMAQEPKKLDGVVEIHGESSFGLRTKDHIALIFYPEGTDDPNRVLEIEFADKTRYPLLLKTSQDSQTISHELYPKEVYEKETQVVYSN